MRESRNTKRSWLGRLMVVEIIVCYMAVLTLVSHVRGPEKYRIAAESPLLAAEEFTSFAGEAAGGELRLENDASGAAVGYSAKLSLKDLEGIHVAFQTDCPAEYAGGTLYVDLYDFEAGYDNAEQEYRLTLEQGINTADFTLHPGESAPDDAQLRFFTLDPAGYDVEGLAVSPVEALPKVSPAMTAAAISCFAVLAATAAAYGLGKRKTGKRTDRDHPFS